MRSVLLWALVALNVLLLAVLVGSRMSGNLAFAQRARSADYLMISGDISGGSTGVVYVLDTTDAKLSAMAYDEGNRQLNTMPPIDLNRVFEAGAGVGTGTGRTRGR